MAVIASVEAKDYIVKKIVFDWSTTGTTGGSTVNYYNGEILRIVATNTATTGGTVDITDDDGNSITLGARALTTGTAYILGTTDSNSLPKSVVCNSKLTCTMASTGVAGTGSIYVYLR
jgi:hypothetical protein